MKKRKAYTVLYYVAAICFYVAAVISFLVSGDSGMGVVWLCLGSAMLALGAAAQNTAKTQESGEKEAEKELPICCESEDVL